MERMVDAVLESAKKYPDHVALQFMGKKTSYSVLKEQIERTAKALVSLGVSDKDIICVVMPNIPQAIVMIYAANLIGVPVNMIHPLSSAGEVEDFVKRVNANTVLILDQFQKLVKGLNLKNVIVASAREALDPFKKLFVKKLDLEPGFMSWTSFEKLGETVQLPKKKDYTKQTALILHSGGTTGKVKGVCLSNFSVNCSATQMINYNPMICSDDRFLSVMPIFHGNGLVIGVHAMLMVGARCVLIPRFTPETYAKDLLKNKCNYMSGVPALYERLIETKVMQNADLSFIKGVFCGADYLSVELEKRLNSFLLEHGCKVPVRQGYGMTEGVVATTLNPCEIQKPGSIGKALEGVSVKIVEPGTDKELPLGETGEIVFSSDTNMTCYYNDPEETAITMKEHSDGKTWIHSGDLGSEDEDGFFFFKGRIKRMIVSNGYNVFPNELENIMESFEMIDRCCVISVPLTEGTSKIVANVVLKKGFEPSDNLKKEIRELCKNNMSRYAVPKDVVFIDQMPKTKVGKVDFRALLENYKAKLN